MRLLTLLALLLTTASLHAADAPLPEMPAARDARMRWWRDARVGMFIHWGLYAIPAGQWNGKEVSGTGEWIMDRANIPVDEYAQLAGQFNPTKYDPARWVSIAKEAGMKYIVITSKHHDGFCLFDTDTTDYDVVDATPYGKDLLKPLAEECKRQGLVFCTYYSIMDWHHPAQYRHDENRYNPTRIHEDRRREYMDFMKGQLKDLLASCDPAVLWFDGEWPDWYTETEAREVYAYLRELKPSLVINNRVGKGRKGMEGLNKGDQQYSGDFGTPEQQIPATGIPGVDWESCMTMNDTWGYKESDQNWKSAETLIRQTIDTASKGGNYLINVGPTAAGEIPAPSVERLAALGEWLDQYGESIYATQASPFPETPWGRATQKPLDGGRTRVYFHIYRWPSDGQLTVSKLGQPIKAVLLPVDKLLSVNVGSDRVTISGLPAQSPDKVAAVIELETK